MPALFFRVKSYCTQSYTKHVSAGSTCLVSLALISEKPVNPDLPKTDQPASPPHPFEISRLHEPNRGKFERQPRQHPGPA